MVEVEKITPSNYLGLDANQLTELYLVEKLSSTQISELCKCHPSTILSYLKKAGTKIRSQSEQKKLYPNPNLKHNMPHSSTSKERMAQIQKAQYTSGKVTPWNKGRKGKYLGDSRKERLTNHDYNPQEIRKTANILIEKYASGELTINRQPPKVWREEKKANKMGTPKGRKAIQGFNKKTKYAPLFKCVFGALPKTRKESTKTKKCVSCATHINQKSIHCSPCYATYRKSHLTGRQVICQSCNQESIYFAKGLCGMCYQKMKRIGKSYNLNNPTIKEIENKFQQPIRMVLEDFLMEGLTTKEIAKKCKVCVQTILKWLRVVNLPVKTRTEGINHAFKKNGTMWDNFTLEQREAHIRKWLKGTRIRPTAPEKWAMAVIERQNLPYKYVGDGKVMIEGKIPDFINVNGQKKVIEVFGNYWHKEKANLESSRTEEGTKTFYKKYGYDVLVIWEDDIKNEPWVQEKLILDFERGGK